MRKLFGTDGIRGRANRHPMTVETATALGRALAARLLRAGRRGRVLIGKDTRLSGYVFESSLFAGVCSMGGRAHLVGVLPTPAIAFLTRSVRADAGVVISASHNPFEDNGIKVFGADGFKLPDEVEEELEASMSGGLLERELPDGSALGRGFRVDDARGRYIEYLKARFPSDLRLDGLKVVVDCAHGAAYRVCPTVLQELGAELILLGCDPDGSNINDGSGALHPEAAAEAVRREGADVGIALDGDADRVILCDERGSVVDGDQMLGACGIRMKAEGRLAGDVVVATGMSNLGLEIALREAGIRLVRTAVGDRYVVEQMRRKGYSLGGEQSGHLIFLESSTTGDGTLAALQLLAIMVREQRPLSEVAAVMDRYPQSLVNVMVREKRPIEELPRVVEAIRAAEAELADRGRVLVRYSGTENKARVMVEAASDDAVERWAQAIAAELQAAVGA